MKSTYTILIVVALSVFLIGGMYMLKQERATVQESTQAEKVVEEDTAVASSTGSEAVASVTEAPAATEPLEKVINKPMHNRIATITTNKGVIKIELFEDTMPITAGNFIKLAESGFYDGTKFHRVIPNFMIQGGDPNTKTDNVASYGMGGPGYAIADEFPAGKAVSNGRTTISMANSGPNSGGSQFFINVAANTFLDGKHPVFGYVVAGMDIADAIVEVKTSTQDRPVEPVVVLSVTIAAE